MTKKKMLDDGMEIPAGKTEDMPDINIAMIVKSAINLALIARLQYDAYIKAGFTKEQAIQLLVGSMKR